MPRYVEEQFIKAVAGDRPEGRSRGPTASGASSTSWPTCAPTGARAFDGSASRRHPTASSRSTRSTSSRIRTSTRFSSGRATRFTRPWTKSSTKC